MYIDSPGRVLDVGCNNGITSQYLLDSGKARSVTGIELHESTVDKSLRDNPNFTFVEGNIVDIELNRRFDHIIYGAVHHHVLNFHGLSAAIKTLQKLATQCDQYLFFETGQIGEGGRWAWQRTMRRYFRTDEDHFFYLLRSIEHLIDGFDVIGQFWIHGIRRSFLRINIKTATEKSAVADGADCYELQADLAGPFGRTFGSRNQQLVAAGEANFNDSPTNFWMSQPGSDTQLFIKQYCHHPVSISAEWMIGRQIVNEWAVRPLGTTSLPGSLVFPYLEDSVPLSSFARAPEDTRQNLANQVVKIYADAISTIVHLPGTCLLTVEDSARLIDVCDLNLGNFLVCTANDQQIIRVVDFEQQSIHYRYRNRMHLSRALWLLRRRRTTALINYVLGIITGTWIMVRYQFRPFSNRVVARQPGFLSLFISEARSMSGRVFGRTLAFLGLE